ncbi:unnamed protein product [Somion occarium]|uniref:Uncharacterized protein n=1 Tax=Somion occarium TaxID=3059160 RepID=A0ABP1CPK6_9APHY
MFILEYRPSLARCRSKVAAQSDCYILHNEMLVSCSRYREVSIHFPCIQLAYTQAVQHDSSDQLEDLSPPSSVRIPPIHYPNYAMIDNANHYHHSTVLHSKASTCIACR